MTLPSGNERRTRTAGRSNNSCQFSTVTALPPFLLLLVVISCTSIYITLSLLNKNASVLQHAEHSMLRPAAASNNKYLPIRRQPRIRTLPYPRAITIDGSKLHQDDDDDDNDDSTKSLKSIQPKSSKTRTSYDYRDPLYEGDCIPMHPWQETSFPTCSTIHELDFYTKSRTGEFAYATSGGYNDIFTLEDNTRSKIDHPKLAFKILQEGTSYTDRNFDRVRRDGVILERSTKSPYVMDIYGFCGFLVLVPFGDQGNLSRIIRRGKGMSSLKKLQLAHEVSAGLAAVHDIDGEKLSAVTQGDLKADQYLFMDGMLKIGDFNRGRFLRRNATAPDTACTYTIGVNDGAYRSPEEYKYLPQTSAIDVWAVGSLMYHILHRHEVWDKIQTRDNKEAQQKVIDGKLPKIADKYKKSDDPAIKAILSAIDMCYVYDPEKRAKAWEVSSFLEKKLDEIKQAKEVE